MYMGLVAYKLAQASSKPKMRGPAVKHGVAEILDGPYPQSFVDFVGQETAVLQIMTSITSAAKRKESVSHILLGSGNAGVGKTALARLTAASINRGFVELGGSIGEKDAAAALKVMSDGDVLFIDEVHRLVSRGKSKAEWLLTLLQDGELQLPTGVIKAPDITVIAATTDMEKLPRTILDRFGVQPILEPYTNPEAVKIALITCKRLGFGDTIPLPADTAWLLGVALACDNNPRRMGNLLMSVRDIALTTDCDNLHGDDGYDLTTALQWNGLTTDGLTRMAQDYLLALFTMAGVAGLPSIKAMLGEEQIIQTERLLIQRGYVIVGQRGRELTDYGMERATALATEKMEAMA